MQVGYGNLNNPPVNGQNQQQQAHPVADVPRNTGRIVFRENYWHFIWWGILWALVFLSNHNNIIFFPACFLTAYLVFALWRKHFRENVPLKINLQTFSWTFWLGTFFAMIGEMILMIAGAFIFLREDIQTLNDRWNERPDTDTCATYNEVECNENHCTWDDAWNVCDRQSSQDFFTEQEPWIVERASVWVFIFFLAFFIAAGVEETIKWYFARRSLRKWLPPSEYMFQSVPFAQTVAFLGLSAGLGFGTSEGVEYTVFNMSPVDAFFSLLIRILMAIPFHACCGLLTGMMLARNSVLNSNYSYFGIIWLPWLLHGTYDFAQFGLYLYMFGEDPTKIAVVTMVVAILITIFTVYLTRQKYKQFMKDVRAPQLSPAAALHPQGQPNYAAVPVGNPYQPQPQPGLYQAQPQQQAAPMPQVYQAYGNNPHSYYQPRQSYQNQQSPNAAAYNSQYVPVYMQHQQQQPQYSSFSQQHNGHPNSPVIIQSHNPVAPTMNSTNNNNNTSNNSPRVSVPFQPQNFTEPILPVATTGSVNNSKEYNTNVAV